MNALDNISKKYQIVLGEVKHTAEMQWDCTIAQTIGFVETHGTTNGTTAVDIFSGIASIPNPPPSVHGVAQMASFSCYNADDIAHTLIIQVVDSATSTTTKKFSVNIAQGYTLHYENGKGWYMTDKNLSFITTVISDSTLTIGESVSGGTHGSILYTDYSGNLANSILNQNAGGNYIFPTDGKFISSADGNVQIDFGAGTYFQATTDAGGFTQGSLYLDAGVASLEFGTNGFAANATTTDVYHATEVRISSPLIKFADQTASRALIINSTNHLDVSTTTDTELSYVHGVTSAIQTQLNARELLANKATDFSTVNNTLYPTVQAAKNYIDSVAQGFTPKTTAKVATTAALPTNTYNNGSSGVGATLTGVATGVLTIDSYTVALNDVVLVKNELSSQYNGLYLCTVAGAIGVAYVLTRMTDMDQSSEFNGAFIPVENAGTVNANSLWLCNSTVTTVGTDAVTFTQLNGATDLIAGNGLSISGNTIQLDTLSSDWNAGGTHGISSIKYVNISGTAGAGFINFIAQSSNASAPSATGFNLFSGPTGNLRWAKKNGSDTYVRGIVSTFTADHDWTLQDATDTFVGRATTDTLTNKTLTDCAANTQAANDNSTKLATTAYVDAIQSYGIYRLLVTGNYIFNSTTGTANTYFTVHQGNFTTSTALTTSGTAVTAVPAMIYISSADFPTINGKAPKLRVVANLITNHTAPAINFTIDLRPLTDPASSGGAGLRSYTIGSAVTGSACVKNTPSADTSYNSLAGFNTNSADFSLPSDGWYVICITNSGTPAANSYTEINAILQWHNN